jgi:hypothetical protein
MMTAFFLLNQSRIFPAFELKTFGRRLAGSGQHVVESMVAVKEVEVNDENRADFNQALTGAYAQKGVEKKRKPVILGRGPKQALVVSENAEARVFGLHSAAPREVA